MLSSSLKILMLQLSFSQIPFTVISILPFFSSVSTEKCDVAVETIFNLLISTFFELISNSSLEFSLTSTKSAEISMPDFVISTGFLPAPTLTAMVV